MLKSRYIGISRKKNDEKGKEYIDAYENEFDTNYPLEDLYAEIVPDIPIPIEKEDEQYLKDVYGKMILKINQSLNLTDGEARLVDDRIKKYALYKEGFEVTNSKTLGPVLKMIDKAIFARRNKRSPETQEMLALARTFMPQTNAGPTSHPSQDTILKILQEVYAEVTPSQTTPAESNKFSVPSIEDEELLQTIASLPSPKTAFPGEPDQQKLVDDLINLANTKQIAEDEEVEFDSQTLFKNKPLVYVPDSQPGSKSSQRPTLSQIFGESQPTPPPSKPGRKFSSLDQTFDVRMYNRDFPETIEIDTFDQYKERRSSSSQSSPIYNQDILMSLYMDYLLDRVPGHLLRVLDVEQPLDLVDFEQFEKAPNLHFPLMLPQFGSLSVENLYRIYVRMVKLSSVYIDYKNRAHSTGLRLPFGSQPSSVGSLFTPLNSPNKSMSPSNTPQRTPSASLSSIFSSPSLGEKTQSYHSPSPYLATPSISPAISPNRITYFQSDGTPNFQGLETPSPPAPNENLWDRVGDALNDLPVLKHAESIEFRSSYGNDKLIQLLNTLKGLPTLKRLQVIGPNFTYTFKQIDVNFVFKLLETLHEMAIPNMLLIIESSGVLLQIDAIRYFFIFPASDMPATFNISFPTDKIALFESLPLIELYIRNISGYEENEYWLYNLGRYLLNYMKYLELDTPTVHFAANMAVIFGQLLRAFILFSQEPGYMIVSAVAIIITPEALPDDDDYYVVTNLDEPTTEAVRDAIAITFLQGLYIPFANLSSLHDEELSKIVSYYVSFGYSPTFVQSILPYVDSRLPNLDQFSDAIWVEPDNGAPLSTSANSTTSTKSPSHPILPFNTTFASDSGLDESPTKPKQYIDSPEISGGEDDEFSD